MRCPLLLVPSGAWCSPVLRCATIRSSFPESGRVPRNPHPSWWEITVRDAAKLPEHLVADEHHADWAGQKGYIPTTVGGGCVLGVGLTASADDAISRKPTVCSQPRHATSNPSTPPRRSTPTVGRRRGMRSRRCFP